MVADKEGNQYRLVMEESEQHFKVWILDGNIQVGWATCILHADGMDLEDIIICEEPVLFPRGLWQLVPSLYSRLKGKNYRQRGLGTELVKIVIEKACEKDVAYICGYITNQGIADNPKLLEWYRKHGFTVTPVSSPGPGMTDKVAWIQMDLR
jgi:GNAT superfamily N-acetyltransferase